jgi:hypothetical protein
MVHTKVPFGYGAITVSLLRNSVKIGSLSSTHGIDGPSLSAFNYNVNSEYFVVNNGVQNSVDSSNWMPSTNWKTSGPQGVGSWFN